MKKLFMCVFSFIFVLTLCACDMKNKEESNPTIYKDYFGVSAISDVVKSRIEHSKYLLFSTGYSLNIISAMCGYKNDVHFMRQFKKLEGISPTQYRNRIKISETEVEKSKNYAPYVIEA